MAAAEAGDLFQYDLPRTGAPVKSDEVRANFEGIARTHYTTDEGKPPAPRLGQLRVNAKDPSRVKLQVWLGTWQDGFTIGTVIVPDDFVTTAVDITFDDKRNYGINCTTGNRIGTLPKASTAKGREYCVKKIDASANILTLTPQAGDDIEGLATLVIATPYAAVRIKSNGANTWWVM